VVDDDRELCEIYSEVLISYGYQVETAADGEIGWKALQAAHRDRSGYDLLITDNNMPRLSGVELVRKLRAAHMAVPVILAAGIVPGQTEALALAAILPKPFSSDELVQAVRAVLRLTRRDPEVPRLS
jgi:DNA-binding response OmpR family regulator